jgi:hypothetical protein
MPVVIIIHYLLLWKNRKLSCLKSLLTAVVKGTRQISGIVHQVCNCTHVMPCHVLVRYFVRFFNALCFTKPYKEPSARQRCWPNVVIALRHIIRQVHAVQWLRYQSRCDVSGKWSHIYQIFAPWNNYNLNLSRLSLKLRFSIGRPGYRSCSDSLRLDGPGIESRWGRTFPYPSRPALGPTQPPVQWVQGSFPAGAWRWATNPI